MMIRQERQDHAYVHGRTRVTTRRLYTSAGYVAAARQMEVGRIERRGRRAVVWLSESERLTVYELTQHKWVAREYERGGVL